eukprot:TRINITY_DN6861_c0_g1_i1.p1 TRINITY_DN6861_c0_g1~~TRINITY_DN6861_c0_g1_i1.p1  ORF type:complete len:595 (+),score=107.94 TRINITY_DN6861_c0_g1_i1:43-1785(+)
MAYFVGVDVGTGSVRAGLVSETTATVIAQATRKITTLKPKADFYEQSSSEIWTGVCECIKEVLTTSGVSPDQVHGIGFDATCSLVVLDKEHKPLRVRGDADSDEFDIIVWMDHRAVEQAKRINAKGHEVLRYVGARISPEMETPKLMWLKENLPDEHWNKVGLFLDLSDFLTFRATGGDETRSLCTAVCKWTFLGHEQLQEGSGSGSEESVPGWRSSYWRSIGLGEIVDEGYKRVGTRFRPMGEPIGQGLCAQAAERMGLNEGTPVAVAIIDAHAGGVGVIGTTATPSDHVTAACLSATDLTKRLALICGTSSCHMAVSEEARFIEGVWGPFYSAMVPSLWLTEGGQSATGALMDHVIDSNALGAKLRQECVDGMHKDGDRSLTVYECLNIRVAALASAAGIVDAHSAQLTRDFHVLPYFHGNRAPRADPSLVGVVSGSKLSNTLDDLAILYLSTIQSLAHGTKHIISEMNKGGYAIDTIVMTGGISKNPLFVREHADITGCKVVLSNEKEAMLLGSALLGAVASGRHESVIAAMGALNPGARLAIDANVEVESYHSKKHRVYLKMYDHLMECRAIMEEP